MVYLEYEASVRNPRSAMLETCYTFLCMRCAISPHESCQESVVKVDKQH